MTHLQGVLRVIGAVCVLALAGVAACDVYEPDRLIRAPVIKSFSPQTAHVDAVVGDSLSFSISAVDPDLGDLAFFFVLADSVVSDSSCWDYVVNDTGHVTVEGHVTNGGRESIVRWTLDRTEPENDPPVIVSWQPVERRPQIILGSSIEFSIFGEDPEGRPLTYVFTVDDTIRSASARLNYQPTRIGSFSVKGIVSDGDRFATHEWDLFVGAEPDSILPAPVEMTSLETGEGAGELVVEWIAVGDDDMEGMASDYEVRTSSVPIRSETDWSNASERAGAPEPVPAGTRQVMIIRNLKPANLVFVAVRAVDDFGNLSPLGNTLAALSKGKEMYGTVRDALTGLPIEGVQVMLLEDSDVTDAQGQYALTRLPDDSSVLLVRDETNAGDYGAYFNYSRGGFSPADGEVHDVWLIPNVSLDTQLYPDVLNFTRHLTHTTGIGFPPLLPTWELPCSVYVPPFSKNEVDYKVLLTEQLALWEQVTGLQFWEPIDHIPTVGLYFVYRNNIDREYHERLITIPPLIPVLSCIHIRTHYDASTERSLRTIALHEIGHALGLAHSSDEGHLMIGGRASAVTEPTLDEIMLVRIISRLPRGIDMTYYQWD